MQRTIRRLRKEVATLKAALGEAAETQDAPFQPAEVADPDGPHGQDNFHVSPNTPLTDFAAGSRCACIDLSGTESGSQRDGLRYEISWNRRRSRASSMGDLSRRLQSICRYGNGDWCNEHGG